MSDEITALLSEQYYEPDSAEAMAMAEQLRGNLGDANFLSLSTIDPVRQFGQESRRNTLNAAESRGRLNKTIAAERRELERKKNEETRAVDRTIASEKRALQRTIDAEKRQYETGLKNKDLKTFWHPTQEGKTLNLERRSDGRYFDQAQNEYPAEVVQTLTPYKAPLNDGSRQNISRQKHEEAKEKDRVNQLLDADVISGALSSDLMQGATGAWYDLPKLAAKYTGAAPDVQSLQNKLSQITAAAAAPMLSTLGINPTDKDLMVAFNTVPQESNEPQVWLDWYAERYAPRLLTALQKYNPELVAPMQERIQKTIAAMQGNITKNESESAFKPPKMEKDKTFGSPAKSGGWSIKLKEGQ